MLSSTRNLIDIYMKNHLMFPWSYNYQIITIYQTLNMDDATGDTNGVGSAYPSGASDFNIDFMVEFRFAFFQC